MKKFVFSLLGVIVVLVVLANVLLFTQLGNNLLKPFLESKINQYSPIAFKVQSFSLRPSTFKLSLSHKDAILINADGKFSLFSQDLNAKIKATFNDLSVLEPSLHSNTPFEINATIEGKFKDLLVKATSNIAYSQTKVLAQIKDFDLSEIDGDIKALSLSALLPMAGQKPYLEGNLNLQAHIKKNQKNTFDGSFKAKIQDGNVDEKLVKNDFKITIPKTHFSLNLQADFKDNKVRNALNLDSNVGSVITSGVIRLPDLKVENVYKIVFSDLSPLTPFVKIPIRGKFGSEGKISGTKDSLIISGGSNVANSQSLYNVELKNFHPQKISLNIKKLSLDKLLWMFYQPEYIKANADIQGNVFDLSGGISSRLNLNASGKFLNAAMKKNLNMDIPDSPFNTQLNISSSNNAGKLGWNFDSSLGKIKLNDVNFDLAKLNASGKYTISLKDLKKLKPIIGVNLVGGFDVDGDFSYDKALSLNFSSNSLGGPLKGSLKDNILTANLKNLHTKKILAFLDIPQVFDAIGIADLNYNLSTQKGKLNANFESGKILASKELQNILKTYAKVDISSEVFHQIDFSSDIHQKTLNAKLKMTSDSLGIDSDHILVDLGQNKLDSKLRVSLKEDFIDLILKGNLNAPKVQINANELIKNQAKKAVQKGANEAIEKYVPKESQDKVKKLLNGVLKGF